MVTPSPIKKSAPPEPPRGSARCSRLPPATPMRPASLLASAWQRFRRTKPSPKASNRGQMLKIQRSSNGEVIFRLAGRLNEEHVAEMETLLMSEAATREIVLDLKDLTLVDRDAVRFLERCEAASIKLKNCPAYIREWIR